MAQVENVHPLWRQMFWQLALSANHLSIMLEREERPEPKLEKYDDSPEVTQIKAEHGTRNVRPEFPIVYDE